MSVKEDYSSPEFHQAQLAKVYTELEKMRVETDKMRVETAKARKELKWYEVTIIVAVTLALVAVVKIFI